MNISLAVGHQIEVSSEQVTVHEPDLVMHSEASAAAILQDGQLLRVNQPVPALVVEVASNGDDGFHSLEAREVGNNISAYPLPLSSTSKTGRGLVSKTA